MINLYKQNTAFLKSKSGAFLTKNSWSLKFVSAFAIIMLLLNAGVNAQFTGTTVTMSGTAISGSPYSSLAAAITGVNALTVTGPVVVTCGTGTEIAPVGGYSITKTGTSVNTITIQGNGAANSIITAFTPQASGLKTDAIIKIVGGDYITIQGFKLQENAANTTTAVATNNMTEFGVGIFLGTATDGAQNNTIQNNTISLGSTYQNAFGIYASSTHSSTNGTLVATTTSGTNSSNKIYNNTISNVAYGIYVLSPANTTSLLESGWDIGGSASGTGNNITFGIATAADLATTSFSAGLSAGITFRNAISGNSVRYNTIISNSLSYAQTSGLGGIVNTGSVPGTGVTNTSTVSNNTITLTNTGTSASTGVDFGFGISTITISASTNIITLNQTVIAANSAAVIGIKANYASATNTCSSNTIVFNQTTSAGGLSSASTGITVAGASTTLTASSNSVTINQTCSGTGNITGALICIDYSAAATTINSLSNTIIVNQTTSVASGITNAITGLKATSAATTLNIGSLGNGNTITLKQEITGSGTYGAGAVTYINAASASATLNIVSNTINNTSSQHRATGTCYAISHNNTITSALTINNNTINLNFGATGPATLNGLYSNGSTVTATTYNLTNNNFTFSNAVAGSTAICIYNTDGPTSGTPANKTVTGNTFVITGNAVILGGLTIGYLNNLTVSGNTINLASSSAAVTSLYGFAISTYSIGAHSITNNTFTALNLTGVLTSAPSVFGIGLSVGNGAAIFGNTISNIAIGAAGSLVSPSVSGILISGGTLVSVYKNKIYGISSLCTGASGLINGILLSGGTTNNVYNNLIGDLTATASSNPDAIRGISITSTTATSTNNIYYNTVYLNASSSGTTFGTTGIFHTYSITSTTSNLVMRNNIIINTSTPGSSSGLTVAFRRNTATDLNNYSTTSNNNLFYAGTPGTTRLIYYDGTNSDQTLAAFKARVTTRETSSITENPTFTSTTGSNSGFLHINPAVYSLINNSAGTGTGITDDFDGDSRSGSTPDIGADEFTGSCTPAQPTSLVLTPTGSNINGSFTAATTSAGGYLVVRTDANSAPSPIDGATYSVGAGTGSLSGSYIEASGTSLSFVSSSGLTGGNTYYYWVFSYSTNCATNPTYTTTSPLTNSAVAPIPCVTPTAQPTSLVLTAISGSSVSGSFTAASPMPSGYLVVRSTSNTELAPVNGTTYTVGSTTFGVGTYVEASGTGLSFSSTGLTSGTTYYYFVYSYATGCAGEPFYYSAVSTPAEAALTNNVTTTACPAPGTYTVGPTGNYTSITQIVNTLSAGCTLTGAVIFELQAAYNSNVETFPINIPALAGSSGTNTVTFRPETGATNLSITSSNATGTINFNAGSNIIFDGRPAGSGTAKELTIENTNVGTSYAVQFINEASSNFIKFCKVRSANTSTTSGTIVFSNTIGVNGNDNNTIDNNDIFDAASGTPTNGIYASGSASPADNSGTTISNNNIYNFYNSTSTSNGGSGLNVIAGNTSWSITGNSVYQTATRTTFGAAAVVNGINVNNVLGNGFTVNSNFIGGTAASCGSGAYTINSTATVTFSGILFSAGIVSSSTVNSNTIQNISITSAAASTSNGGIRVLNGAVTINANTIGSQSTIGSIIYSSSAAAGFRGIQAGTGTTGQGAISITNNLIGGISVTGSGTVSLGGIIFQSSGLIASTQYTITGNTIGSSTTANSLQNSTNAFLYGISGIAAQTTSTNSISNNTIANLTSSNSGTSNIIIGINTPGSSGGIYNTTSNTIFNLTTTSTATGTNTAASVIGILHTAATTAGQTVSQNTIHSLSNTAPTGTVGVVGIVYSGPTTGTNLVARNFIHSLFASSNTITTAKTGIYVAAGTTTFQNNKVRLGVLNTAVGYIIRGINDAVGTNNYYFNSVYIGGTSVATGGSNTFAFTSAVNSGTRLIQNNIFFNARSNAAGTAKHYAISLAGTTGLTINYNDYYVNGTGGVLGFFASVDKTDLSAWRLSTVQDANSRSGDPQFITPEGSSTTVNLHINASNPTPVEGTGLAISGISDDIDGDVRANFTATDMGADAGDFTASVANDIAAVSFVSPINGGSQVQNIAFTPQASFINNGTTTQTSVTVRYKIIDGGSTVVYNQTATISSLAAGISTTVSFPSATVTGTGSYTIQAIAELVGDATTSNDQINGSIIFDPQLAGDYLVGSAQSAPYNTITNAIAKLNTVGVSAAVRFLLTDATYASETFPLTINSINGASGINTFTIKPNTGVTAIISGSSSTSIFRFNGADYVTIDGSNSGATDKNLTITNTATTATTASIWISSTGTGAGATNNTIKNCTISNGSSAVNNFGIAVSGASIGINGADNDSLTIQGNTFSSCATGIYAIGTASVSSGGLDNLNINNNSVTTNTSVTSIGIQLGNALNASISQNTLDIQQSATGAPVGISLETGFNTSIVTKNKIVRSFYTGSSGYGGRGITIGTASATSAITISNNIIYGVNGDNFSGFDNSSSMGIAIGMIGGSSTINTVAGGINLYNNSVNMYGTYSRSATACITTALYVGSAASVLDIRNNIFVNSLNNTTNASSKAYAIYSVAANTAFTTINYNDYYVSGSQGVLGFLTSDRTNLAGIVLGFGGNASSVSVLPNFTSSTDLHLTASGNCNLNNAGTPISGITTDYDGDTRSITLPDIGADEFTGDINTAGAASTTPTLCISNTLTNITHVTTGATGIGSATGLPAGVSAAWVSDTITISGTPSASGTFNYSIPLTGGTCSVNATGTITVTANKTAAAASSTPTLCISNVLTSITHATTGATGIGTATGLPSGVTAAWASNTITISGTPSASGTFNYTIPLSGGCGSVNATGTITVTAANTAAAASSTPTLSINNALTNITHATTGATGIGTATGLPTGVSAAWASDIITISGTPSASGTFNYTIPLSGGCGSVNATGTITVIPINDWIGGTGSWNTTTNWSLSRVPLSSDNITISTGSPEMDVDYTLASGRTLTISGTGSLTINPNFTLTIAGTADFGGKLVTVKSDATGSGSIGQITGTLNNASNVNVERFIPSSTRRYRFLSSPVSNTAADWRGEIFITGGGVSSEYLSVGLSNIKSNGLDWTLSGAPSMFGYTETLNSGDLNTRWEAITNANTTSLIAGKGYRVFVRGDRSDAGVLDNSVSTQSAVTIISSGTVNAGTITLPATNNGSTSDDGWNLVGNPYPSTIDWNAASGWTKTNVFGTIYIYNPSINTYGSWDGGTATNSVTQYISSGQAFFVRTNGTPTLTCTEAVKTSTTGAAIFKTDPENTLRISLAKDATNSDETVIRFMEGKQNEFSDNDDVRKMINPEVNISSNFGLDQYASVNYLAPKDLKNKVVPISAWVDVNGSYQLKFKGVESFIATPYVMLKDKYLNKWVDLRTNAFYQFDITNDKQSKDDNRFEVIFTDKSSGLNESNALLNAQLSVYPNPATDVLNVSLTNGTAIENVSVYNVSGMLVNNIKLNGTQIDISQLNNGVYMVEVKTANGNYQTKFVK